MNAALQRMKPEQDTRQTDVRHDTMSAKNYALGMAARQALIMMLGALEDWLGVERSITPRRKR